MLITLNISIKSPYSRLSVKNLEFFHFYEKDKLSQFCQYPFVSRDSTLAHYTPNVALLDIHLALYTIFLISNVLFILSNLLYILSNLVLSSQTLPVSSQTF